MLGRGVGAGQHAQHARCGLGLALVDADDLGMGVGRQDLHRMGLARQVDVLDIGAVAGEEPLILDAADGLPDPETSHSSLPCLKAVPRMLKRKFALVSGRQAFRRAKARSGFRCRSDCAPR